MTNKIKERIKYFKHYIVDNLSLDAQDDFQKILDYITNLQEENEELKTENEKLTQLWLNSQEKRRKAIEYTKQFVNGKTSRIDEWENVELVLETIVQLLQGENNGR